MSDDYDGERLGVDRHTITALAKQAQDAHSAIMGAHVRPAAVAALPGSASPGEDDVVLAALSALIPGTSWLAPGGSDG